MPTRPTKKNFAEGDADYNKIKSMLPGQMYDIDGVDVKWLGLVAVLEPGRKITKAEGNTWTQHNPDSAMWKVDKRIWRFVFVKPNGFYVMVTERALDRLHLQPQYKPRKRARKQ